MILGKQVRFRRDERGDLPKFAEWLSDPDVVRYLGGNFPVSLANEERWFEHMLALPFDEQPYAIEVRRENGGEAGSWQLIGNCSFMEIDKRSHSAEVGLFIGDKACWNKGYGTEVMRLLLRIGFETLNLNRIFLRVNEDNLGGIRAYEKAGFVHEGRMRQAAYVNGEYRDMLFMSVLRSEWKPEEKQAE